MLPDPERTRTQEHTGPLPSGPEYPWTDALPTSGEAGELGAEAARWAERATDALDDLRLVADLSALVSIPSTGGSPEEVRVQRWGAETLRRMGGSVDEWDESVADLARLEDWPGQEVERTDLRGVVGRFGPAEGDPALILCGHTDVVPATDAELWSEHDPWTLVRGEDEHGVWFRGRGVTDMKGGVAAVLAAVRALQSVGFPFRRALAVHLVSGEEDGGSGAFATLRRGHTGEACVIAEPTAGHLVTANAGSLTFSLRLSGRAAHGAMAREGHNALLGLRTVVDALERLQEQRREDRPVPFDTVDDPWPLSIGIVRGGEWASTVLDDLVVEGRFGVRTDETPQEARAAFEQCVAEACAADDFLAEHPARVTWPGGVFAPGEMPSGHELGAQVADAVERAGYERPDRIGVPYGSDLRQYAAAGIPTLQYGPGDIRQAHSVDEWVDKEALVRCARAYVHLVVERCG
ncbi:M20/M25/M40 family metallo-hydrolase [Kytococcus sp. HMSC28H12]|uniref:M20/M25/M40 family metallo-hydrolase n=1 Tax=Kytococcus TaxID=57499 RepID=UPI0009F6192A|nr:M20/M25/M40 family metallo-hydrolase [Kytococcus sp. HMSC28H12]